MDQKDTLSDDSYEERIFKLHLKAGVQETALARTIDLYNQLQRQMLKNIYDAEMRSGLV